MAAPIQNSFDCAVEIDIPNAHVRIPLHGIVCALCFLGDSADIQIPINYADYDLPVVEANQTQWPFNSECAGRFYFTAKSTQI